MTTIQRLAIGLVLAAAGAAPAADPPRRFEDQFERPADVGDLRGAVVVLVYGDRAGTEFCRHWGEFLHLYFHPTAKGLPPAKALQAPVGLLPTGKPGPDVCVVPVACCGKVPAPVRALIRAQVAKATPDVPVWLDFKNTMTDTYGIMPGAANVVVFDTTGAPRLAEKGNPDAAGMTKLLEKIQGLRAEAAGK